MTQDGAQIVRIVRCGTWGGYRWEQRYPPAEQRLRPGPWISSASRRISIVSDTVGWITDREDVLTRHFHSLATQHLIDTLNLDVNYPLEADWWNLLAVLLYHHGAVILFRGLVEEKIAITYPIVSARLSSELFFGSHPSCQMLEWPVKMAKKWWEEFRSKILCKVVFLYQ